MPRSREQTREQLLEVAHELFYWDGIRATGVDEVAARADVAPTTLYRLFGSKDALIGTYMQRASERYQDFFNAAARGGGTDPRQQILAVFDAVAGQVQPDRCRGCPFLMALAEFPDPAHPAPQSRSSTGSAPGSATSLPGSTWHLPGALPARECPPRTVQPSPTSSRWSWKGPTPPCRPLASRAPPSARARSSRCCCPSSSSAGLRAPGRFRQC